LGTSAQTEERNRGGMLPRVLRVAKLSSSQEGGADDYRGEESRKGGGEGGRGGARRSFTALLRVVNPEDPARE